jgi:WhiB family redox-sensing transcriptional regulator
MSTATLLAALSIDVDAWGDQGSCVQDGADLFFDRHDELGHEREDEAKARCAMCPVLAQCREWALAAGDPSGVWAGETTTAARLAA